MHAYIHTYIHTNIHTLAQVETGYKCELKDGKSSCKEVTCGDAAQETSQEHVGKSPAFSAVRFQSKPRRKVDV